MKMQTISHGKLDKEALSGIRAAAAGLTNLAHSPKVLSRVESDRMWECEQVIEKGLDTFMEVGERLREIRDSRLYRERYATFEQYCEGRWDMTARRARQLCAAVEVVHNLLPGPAQAPAPDIADGNQGSAFAAPKPVPTSERQARPLTTLPKEEQQEAWNEAVATAPGGQVTAKHVEEVVRKRSWPKPNEHGVFDDKAAENIEFNHNKAYAVLRILEIGDGKWISAVDCGHHQGSMAGHGQPLSARLLFPTRDAALTDAAQNLIADQKSIAKGTNSGHTPAQRAVAKRMIEWAHRYTSPQDEFALQAESIANPPIGLRERVALALGELVRSMKRVRAMLIEAADEARARAFGGAIKTLSVMQEEYSALEPGGHDTKQPILDRPKPKPTAKRIGKAERQTYKAKRKAHSVAVARWKKAKAMAKARR